MHIAIDLTARLPETTGVDNYLMQLVTHLGKIDRANEYRVYVNYEDRDLFDGVLPGHFTIVPLSLRPRPVRLLFQQIVLPLATHRWKADVLHSPSFLMPFFRGRSRHVLTVHDMTFFSLPQCHTRFHRSKPFRDAVLKSIHLADAVIVPSRSVKQAVLRFMPELPPRRIHVIAFGIGDEFRLHRSPKTQEVLDRLGIPRPYILHVGTIEPRKNLERLVESYRKLVVSGTVTEHLVLAGRLGWGYDELLRKIDSPELAGRVHLKKYVSQEDLPHVYAGARIFVYPSLEEGFGFPPLEAMACAVPTISSLSSSMADNLQGAAELVRPDDVDALAEAMRRLLRDPSLHARRSKLGVERAAKFRWDETARQTLRCYAGTASK